MNQTAEHHHRNLTLLQQLQALKILEAYSEFCYQLYLVFLSNTLNRNGDTLTYTPFNKPATLQDHNTSQRVTFTYGIGKVRYAKENSLGQYTYYIGKAYEEQVEDNTEKQICYIMLGGKSIGTHIEVKDTDYVSSNPNYNEASYNRYFHTDALGSISAITNDAGEVVERRSYTPFGKIRAMDYGTNHNTLANTLTQTTRAYTGHEQIVELSGLARSHPSSVGMHTRIITR